ncbi:MAG: RNB domain-containing ribonuclease, partial [Atopobiaceae bacterium]|nr:RNB domain-containing ribonuclease [Atopobiaceae bacterium]
MARRRSRRPLGRPNTSGTRSKGTHVIEGILHVTRPGVATISSEEGSFTVAKSGIREGMNGDRVRATLSKRSGEEVRAYVQSVIERSSTTFLGSYHTLEPLGVVVPLDERIRRDFFVLPEDDSARRLGVAEGDLVAARILTYPSRNEAGVATIERRVGASSDLDLNIEGIIASYDLAIAFPEDALAEARAYTLDVEGALANDATRRDLRDEYCFTIDPSDAKDFDDAVFAEELDGGYRLCVHIADVSHYVSWGSSVDIEARRRTTSVYLVDRVLPMLPEELSNDLCSLRPDEDRLCISVVVELDARGEVVEADAFPSVIRSRARLDYDRAQAILDGIAHAEDGVPAKVVVAIRILDRISKLRQKVR